MPDRYFEEHEIGQRWTTWARTVTEADVVNFAGLSGDFYPIHVDQQYAEQSLFGRRIAHGVLVLSFATGMVPAVPGRVVAFYGIDRLRFLKPTFIGDTVHVEMEVVDLRDKGDAGGIVDYAMRIVNQHGDPVILCNYLLLMHKRPAT
jgi:3-hydroxybutyryl-CoA dehydratase